MPVTLQPRPGFNWLQVSWGGPYEVRTLKCSYCEAPINDDDDDDDDIPLIVWNNAGWCAEFCRDCQVTWWGFSPLAPPPDDELDWERRDT
jgi:hypothetical protein